MKTFKFLVDTVVAIPIDAVAALICQLDKALQSSIDCAAHTKIALITIKILLFPLMRTDLSEKNI